jgi:four helix bundle protein
MSETKIKYNLEERTKNFAENIIKFAKKIPKTAINLPIIGQLVDAGTSVGANYHEANGASSKKDFKNKIYICKKESKETKYWLELIVVANPELREEGLVLIQESHELILIFSKIIITIESKTKN